MLPELEEFPHHQLHLSRVELKEAMSSPSVETRATGMTKFTELTDSGVTPKLHGHAAGTFHLGLYKKSENLRKYLHVDEG